MDIDSLVSALALVLILEGLLPFALPNAWRKTMLELAQWQDRQLRSLGLISMGVGLLILWFLA